MDFHRSATFWIIVSTLLLFFLGLQESATLPLYPADFLSGAYWQAVTYMFLHASLFHITSNMFIFLIFAFPVERSLGTTKFLLLYLISGVSSALFFLLLEATGLPLVGASGAVFGVMTAYAVLYPKNWIFIPPGLPLPALPAIILIMLFETFLGIFSVQPDIANFGHVGGIITGFVFMMAFRLFQKKEPDDETGFAAAENVEYFWE